MLPCLSSVYETGVGSGSGRGSFCGEVQVMGTEVCGAIQVYHYLRSGWTDTSLKPQLLACHPSLLLVVQLYLGISSHWARE